MSGRAGVGSIVAASALGMLGMLVAPVAQPGTSATPREAAVNGAWALAKPLGPALRDVKGAPPPLNAAGKKLYEPRAAMLAKGDKSFDLSQRCKPIGFPRALWDGSPFDIQVQPTLVFMGFTWNRNHRIVDVSQDAPKLQVPRYYGTGSAGWDGDTLVVRSAFYNTNAMLDSSGLPFSDEMTLVERYTPTNGGKSLTVQVTITDPRYYTRPWTVEARFNRVPDGRILEDVCQERSEYFKSLVKGG